MKNCEYVFHQVHQSLNCFPLHIPVKVFASYLPTILDTEQEGGFNDEAGWVVVPPEEGFGKS